MSSRSGEPSGAWTLAELTERLATAGAPVYGVQGRPFGLTLAGFAWGRQGAGANAVVLGVTLMFAASSDGVPARHVILVTHRRRLVATGDHNPLVSTADASSAEPAPRAVREGYAHFADAGALRAVGDLEESSRVTVGGLLLAGRPYSGSISGPSLQPAVGMKDVPPAPQYIFWLLGEHANVMIIGTGFTLAEMVDLLEACVDVTTRRELLAQYAEERRAWRERWRNQ